MINIESYNYNLPKYTFLGDFKEGLAVVRNRSGLYGYIDKRGKEVIPCQFTNAKSFSEGLAAVKNSENLWGFIDKEGKVKILPQFEDAEDFHEGYAAVSFKLRGTNATFIDTEGKSINRNFLQVTSFYNGYGAGCTCNQKEVFIDHDGNLSKEYEKVLGFSGDIGFVQEKSEILLIDNNFKPLKKINPGNLLGYSGYIEFSPIPVEGFRRIKINNTFGYTDAEFKLKIPCVYRFGNIFSDGVAVVELDRGLLGFVDKEGKTIVFPDTQYTQIKDFSEGLAAVQNTQGLCGFINKNGKEVIPCQYKEVGTFSEGLCWVLGQDGKFHYINKLGNIKITVGDLYCSMLSLEEESVFITAKSEEELFQKKISILNVAKERLMNRIKSNIDSINLSDIADLYEHSLEKRKTKKKPKQI